MPDRERVIKAWEIFRDSNPYEICSGREFRAIREPEYCMGQMIEDTIALLKEQPEIVRCKDCKYCVKEPNGELYCDILAVGYEPLGSKKVTEDGFCADGERRDDDD